MSELKPLQLLCSTALLVLAGKALAHDAWIEARDQSYAVLYGHADKLGGYAPEKVKAVAAVDAKGAVLPVGREAGPDSLRLTLKGKPALATMHFEGGYWSKTTEGSKNLPKNEVSGALSTTHYVKYGKTIFAWGPIVMRPQGQQLEIIPLSPAAPVAGKELPVQVLWEGKPLAGAKIMRSGSKGKPVETDAEGKVRVEVVSGKQLLGTSHKQELTDDPRADVYSASANLVFEAR